MKYKILSALSIITGLLFINGGLNKFFNYMPPPDNIPEPMAKDFQAIMEISWLMPLIGSAELVGGILLLFARTRPLAVLILCPVVVGILLTHIFVEPSGLPIALIIAAILGWIIYEYRDKYLPLIGR